MAGFDSYPKTSATGSWKRAGRAVTGGSTLLYCSLSRPARDRASCSASAGPAAEVLRELARTPHISGLVFANPKGRTPFPRGAWGATLVAAQIADFRFHDLRHTAASYLAMNGATLPELAAFLGHRSMTMVARYSHFSEDHSEAVAERMAAAFLGGAGA